MIFTVPQVLGYSIRVTVLGCMHLSLLNCVILIVPQDTPGVSVGQGVQMEHTGEPAVHDIIRLLQTVPLDLTCLVVRPDVLLLVLLRGGSGLSYDATRALLCLSMSFFFFFFVHRKT